MRPKLPKNTGTAASKCQWNDRTRIDADQDVQDAIKEYNWSDGKKTVSIYTEIDDKIQLPRRDQSLDTLKETLPNSMSQEETKRNRMCKRRHVWCTVSPGSTCTQKRPGQRGVWMNLYNPDITTTHTRKHNSVGMRNHASKRWRIDLVSPWRQDCNGMSRHDTHGTRVPPQRKAVGGSTT